MLLNSKSRSSTCRVFLTSRQPACSWLCLASLIRTNRTHCYKWDPTLSATQRNDSSLLHSSCTSTICSRFSTGILSQFYWQYQCSMIKKDVSIWLSFTQCWHQTRFTRGSARSRLAIRCSFLWDFQLKCRSSTSWLKMVKPWTCFSFWASYQEGLTNSSWISYGWMFARSLLRSPISRV